MRFIEMGSDAQPTLLFIHGLSATAESCYGEVGRLLQRDWHVVLCELDGHYEGSPPFFGVDSECRQIEEYVRKSEQGKIHGLIGLSLGGTIAVSLLGRGRIQVERCVLDAAFCVDMGFLRGFFTFLFPTGVGRIRDGKYVPGFVVDTLMGKRNRSVIEMLYPGITVETCKNACRDVYAYHIPENLKRQTAAVEFWRGSNEPYPKKNAALLREQLPNMTERVFPGMGHCQFLHEQPKKYAELVDAFAREA
jgi:pimeloyl-ACP methyl ester carboxylesterase